MGRSFGIVDETVIQAEYFLNQLAREQNLVAIRANVVAFASAYRSITYALQASLAGDPCFKEWYVSRRCQLSQSELAKYFRAFSRITHHIGANSINFGFKAQYLSDLLNRKNRWFFGEHPDFPKPPSVAQWYFTVENFSKLGFTIEDAAEELGFPRGWTIRTKRS
jgi:hypothetical protein